MKRGVGRRGSRAEVHGGGRVCARHPRAGAGGGAGGGGRLAHGASTSPDPAPTPAPAPEPLRNPQWGAWVAAGEGGEAATAEAAAEEMADAEAEEGDAPADDENIARERPVGSGAVVRCVVSAGTEASAKGVSSPSAWALVWL